VESAYSRERAFSSEPTEMVKQDSEQAAKEGVKLENKS
jgi:hypothetical protein